MGYPDLHKQWEWLEQRTCSHIVPAERSDLKFASAAYKLEYYSLVQALQEMTPNKLIVLNGPRGVGKSTVGHQLEEMGVIRIPVVTNRTMRPSEREGRDCFFVSDEEMHRLVAEDKVLALKNTKDYVRAFLKDSFQNLKAENFKIFYAEGERTLRAYQEACHLYGLDPQRIVNVFLLPNSYPTLWQRLQDQQQQKNFNEEQLYVRGEQGLERLEHSVRHYRDFPKSVYLVNDDIERVAYILSLFVRNNRGDPKVLIPLWDDQLHIRGISSKQYSHIHSILHPIVVVYVLNERGELLLQRRADSGQWDHSTAGHIRANESAQKAAERELSEEIGISGVSLQFIGESMATNVHELTNIKHYFSLFSCRHNGPFVLQKEEVLATRFSKLDEIRQDMETNPHEYSGGFHASFKFYLQQSQNGKSLQ